MVEVPSFMYGTATISKFSRGVSAVSPFSTADGVAVSVVSPTNSSIFPFSSSIFPFSSSISIVYRWWLRS